jgi:hypothetical protein
LLFAAQVLVHHAIQTAAQVLAYPAIQLARMSNLNEEEIFRLQVHALLEQSPQSLVTFMRHYPQHRRMANVMVKAMPSVLTSLQLLTGASQLPTTFHEQVYRSVVQTVLGYASALLLDQARSKPVHPAMQMAEGAVLRLLPRFPHIFGVQQSVLGLRGKSAQVRVSGASSRVSWQICAS